jgi:hypothetical protein
MIGQLNAADGKHMRVSSLPRTLPLMARKGVSERTHSGSDSHHRESGEACQQRNVAPRNHAKALAARRPEHTEIAPIQHKDGVDAFPVSQMHQPASSS